MLHDFTTGSHRLIYESTGDPAAPTILLVHGWLSHRGVWRQTLPALQDKYHCITLDLLGFGDSDKPADGDYSIAAQAQRVLDLADHLNCARFSLIGHSMGGQICSLLAARLAPARVERLVSVAGVMTGKLSPEVERLTYPLVALSALFPPLYHLSARLARWEPFSRFLFAPWFYRMDAVPFELWEIDRRMALRPEIAMTAKLAGLAIHRGSLMYDLPHISAPTLGIYARLDGTVPFADAELLQRLTPGARLAVIEACGHFPMYEQTEAYLQALTRFFN